MEEGENSQIIRSRPDISVTKTPQSDSSMLVNEMGAAALCLSPIQVHENSSNLTCSTRSIHKFSRSYSPAMLGSRSQDHLANLSFLTQGARGVRIFNNPNKAWAIISSSGSGEVLISNSIFRQLLQVEEKDKKISLWEYIETSSKHKHQTIEQLGLDTDTGDTLSYNGEVVTLMTASKTTLTVSMSTRILEDPTRILVFLEVLHKTVGHIDIDSQGLITNMDEEAENIFQQKITTCLGEQIQTLIPVLNLPGLAPGSVIKEACTGKTEDDLYFPISVIISRDELGSAVEYSAEIVPSCSITVWVYSTLSGLILLDGKGIIQDCDQGLSGLVLGYRPGELHGNKIESVLPGFYDEFDVPSCDRTEEDLGCEELSLCTELSEDQALLEDQGEEEHDLGCAPLEEISISVENCLLNSPNPVRTSFEYPGSQEIDRSPVFKRPALKTPVKLTMDMFTSTPAHGQDTPPISRGSLSSTRKPRLRTERSLERSRRKLKDRNLFASEEKSFDDLSCSLPTGCFYGLAKHKNGTEISTLYQVKRIDLKGGETVYCLWLSRDEDDTAGKTQNNLTLETTGVNDCALRLGADENAASDCELSEESLLEGDYNTKYTTLVQLGKGAYGTVWSAYRRVDLELVVVKCILKKRVLSENWVMGDQGKYIPFEASLLMALNHPNIVRVLEVFQNTAVVQLVMAKHGDMDLFEFIDRNPVMDEALTSHIFNQIVQGIDYLHSKDILHRDIKDENVIIDNRFNVQIIDFGSATFFQPGDVFTTFYGTVEYCAPEVLKGNAYDGPQVEIWALGVLLYILVYGENPFYDATDTVRAELHPPHLEISSTAWGLIESILEPDPEKRASLWFIKEHSWVTQHCAVEDYRFQGYILKS
ncbi:PAS domain-containing serine/threonine-protein kinase isoform X2 [Eurytemora carolleeae]|uniref:PAS domain-containing serine/threonine-protein kinase isoform X2 n=1 Tax=Eurytemora carolleeae TaxID=1294199 RepID=UPI000C77AED4|nr:PAS domain-containing serine/threonine-protein kinase isoform X2 [Eurytemora carolleeae]|eukprot:XP_023349299.1 PAS domain-containing serine/threonine-protein kinase-like isoform X2 [Eurytemora affinis]